MVDFSDHHSSSIQEVAAIQIIIGITDKKTIIWTRSYVIPMMDILSRIQTVPIISKENTKISTIVIVQSFKHPVFR